MWIRRLELPRDTGVKSARRVSSDGRGPGDSESFGFGAWTDHNNSGNIWHETSKVLNSQNQELFGFGVWDSPRV